MNNKFASTLVFASVLCITACGGGDDGGTAVPQLGVPVASFVLSATDSVQTKIEGKDMEALLLGGSDLGYLAFSYAVNRSATRITGTSSQALQRIWITPEVTEAWSQGWTGHAVKVGILDDFTADDGFEFLKVQYPPGCASVLVTSNIITICSESASAAYRVTHGDQVAGIAGSATATFYGTFSEFGSFTSGSNSGAYTGKGDVNAAFSTPYYGIAKDAQIIRGDFLAHQSATDGLFAVLKRWGVDDDTRSRLYREVKVTNISLAASTNDPVVNQRIFDSQFAYASQSITPDIVFIKAAGNLACSASELNCDPINKVLYSAATFKDKTILVGALDAPGGQIASYSNLAGAYADRFVVSDGRGIHIDGDSYESGTSFAAPRVTGYAAIIRQKFPGLNAASVAKAILDSAVWHPAWGQKTAATQAIYGQGEASLSRALALADTLR